jgi:hypothetical protein
MQIFFRRKFAKIAENCDRSSDPIFPHTRYCSEHARKALLARQKISSHPSPADLTQKCLQSLLPYKRDPIKSEPCDPQQQQLPGPSRGFPAAPGIDFGSPKLGDLKDLEKEVHPFREYLKAVF